MTICRDILYLILQILRFANNHIYITLLILCIFTMFLIICKFHHRNNTDGTCNIEYNYGDIHFSFKYKCRH